MSHDPGIPIPERLRNLQAAQAAANELRNRQCNHIDGTTTYAWRLRTGELRYFEGCITCQARTSPTWISHATADNPPLVIDERTANPPCARCGAFGTQLHHFAPKHLFGTDEADLWPTAHLCKPCHDYWHRVTQTGRHQP